MSADGWHRVRFEFSNTKPTIYVNGLLYHDPKRGRLFNLWLRWTFRFRHWRTVRHARGAS